MICIVLLIHMRHILIERKINTCHRYNISINITLIIENHIKVNKLFVYHTFKVRMLIITQTILVTSKVVIIIIIINFVVLAYPTILSNTNFRSSMLKKKKMMRQ